MRIVGNRYSYPRKEFEIFFRKYYKLALLVSGRITRDLVASEDIVQDVFFALWEKSDSSLHAPTLKSYLLKSVKNRSLNHIRDKKKQTEISSHFSEVTNEDYDFERDEKISQILFEVENLPPRCKDVFKLIALKRLKYSEAAQILGVTNNTVKTQLLIAYKHLRKIYLIFL